MEGNDRECLSKTVREEKKARLECEDSKASSECSPNVAVPRNKTVGMFEG